MTSFHAKGTGGVPTAGTLTISDAEISYLGQLFGFREKAAYSFCSNFKCSIGVVKVCGGERGRGEREREGE